MKESKVNLDGVPELQNLIESKEWQDDNSGILIFKALEICATAGATIDDAIEYLEIADDLRAGWREYMASRF